METRVYLCKDGHCCPSVDFVADKVHIGEDGNTVVLSKEQWNILVVKIREGELTEM